MEEHPLSKHLQRVYPLDNRGIDRSYLSLTLSSLSLSENSDDDSLPDSWRQRVPAPFYETVRSQEESGKWKKATSVSNDSNLQHPRCKHHSLPLHQEVLSKNDHESLRRCNWITKSSDQVIVSFHDECWGVPVFSDSQLFELLSLSGLLIDHNWTEILKRRSQYREVFANFDHNVVAKMEEKDIKKISSIKKLTLGERRLRCIVDNAKCIQKVAKEYGSFSGYIWSHVNHRPIINKLKHQKRTLLRTAKSKHISDDLLRRGFRQVSAVVVYSFMQAAGMVNNHHVDCFRFQECVKIAERSWGMTNMAM